MAVHSTWPDYYQERFLTELADVYTEHATTGLFSVLVKATLACRIRAQPAPSGGPYRGPVIPGLRLFYAPDYTLPEGCQILKDGVRYNPVTGTHGYIDDLNERVVVRTCQIERAIDG